MIYFGDRSLAAVASHGPPKEHLATSRGITRWATSSYSCSVLKPNTGAT